MSKKMLIDASHSEETRVAVVSENLLEDYDFESILRKSLKGNIYLAKVTRVEPSLQAAFVNFGGNRHGFLPFSEIHPDYFKIPVADREALMAEQEELARKMQQEEEDLPEEDDDSLEEAEKPKAKKSRAKKAKKSVENSSDENPEVSQDMDEGGEEEVDAQSQKPKRKTRRRKPAVKTQSEDEDIASDSESVDEEKADPSEAKSKKKTTRRKPRAQAAKVEADEVVADDIAQSEDNDGNTKKPRKTARRGRKKKLDADEPNGNVNPDEPSEDADADGNTQGADEGNESSDDKNNKRRRNYRGRRGRRGGKNRRGGSHGRHQVKEVGGGDDYEEDEQTALWKKMRRSYKIQEVIKRGQIMLVQVQKEERGNKGAAVTSYITLPGRYSVLMPNSPRGGGVSRKIPFKERKSLKSILNDMTIPKGMSIIIRTAGIGRTKSEIKKDLDYLYRLWDTIRDLTLKSTAPSLVYEEGNLVKRAIRDIYTRDIEEVHVAGEDGYKTAKDFMKMMIPSHAKRIQKYQANDELPLFHRYQVEAQIDEIHNTQVQLPSGGYLVINPTEALVSIDVNSGRATKERHIEETALKTNMEAAVEVARQLRLRDLGGLVVIDFIDMEDYRNNREVERKLADALSIDRARVQMGRISNFGLMELSRQRLRPSLTETHFEVCPHCKGAGHVPTTDVAALRILRAIEEEGIKHRSQEITVTAPTAVVNYLLNHKRHNLSQIEQRYGFIVHIEIDHDMGPSDYELERTKGTLAKKGKRHQADSKSQPAAVSEDEVEGADKIEDAPFLGKEPEKPKRGRRNTKAKKPQAETSDQGEDSKSAEADAKPAPKKPKRPQESELTEKSEDKVEDAAKERPVAAAKEDDVPLDSSAAEAEAEVETQAEPKDYEVVNQAPKKKKKGWWQKLVE